MAHEDSIGKRFSQIYLKRGEPTQDSIRMRRRLKGLVYDIDDFGSEFASEINRELGIQVPYLGGYHDWEGFLTKCELRDLLDLVTVGYNFLRKKERRGLRDPFAPRRWLQEIGRIFSEENVRYKVDLKGGVHFSIDQEFETARNSAISALDNSRYSNVLHEFEDSYSQLSENPPETKKAIRAIFASAEGLFRLMFPDAPRLTSQEVDKRLAPTVQRKLAGDPAALGAASKLLNSFKDWIDGAHFYRHEQGQEQISQPPLLLAISFLSLGASYIRWLAEMDEA